MLIAIGAGILVGMLAVLARDTENPQLELLLTLAAYCLGVGIGAWGFTIGRRSAHDKRSGVRK